jgi:hypothetical protein
LAFARRAGLFNAVLARQVRKSTPPTGSRQLNMGNPWIARFIEIRALRDRPG